ncbi:MAG: hypothetical protein IPO29_17645 [Anaerolineae bacterium]|nr:hypothetical protein [Anaerolineae bacterium]
MLSLAVILLMLCLMLAVLQRRAGRAPRDWRAAAALFAGVWVLPVGFLGLAANLIPDHVTPQACAIDAVKIAALLKPQDLLISDWARLACAPEAKWRPSAWPRPPLIAGWSPRMCARISTRRSRRHTRAAARSTSTGCSVCPPPNGSRFSASDSACLLRFWRPSVRATKPDLGATTPQGVSKPLAVGP